MQDKKIWYFEVLLVLAVAIDTLVDWASATFRLLEVVVGIVWLLISRVYRGFRNFSDSHPALVSSAGMVLGGVALVWYSYWTATHTFGHTQKVATTFVLGGTMIFVPCLYGIKRMLDAEARHQFLD